MSKIASVIVRARLGCASAVVATALFAMGCDGGGGASGSGASGSAGSSGASGSAGSGGASGSAPDPNCFDYSSFDATMPVVSFKDDVLPIFQRSCGISTSCHGDASAPD